MEIIMDKEPITVNGLQKLKLELEDLKNVQRPKVVEAIAEARSHGDLKENAEYHAAREQQGFIEGRISEIESKLSRSQVIDISKIEPSDRVIFGATVSLYSLAHEKLVQYRIVGEDEANVKNGLISVTSPIARAIIGKEIGDEVSVSTPGGLISFEIEDVIYR